MRKLLLKALVIAMLPTMAMATPGTYVKGELGAINLTDGQTKMFNFSDNPSGAAGRLSAGYLWGDENLNYGVEGGGLYFNNANYNYGSGIKAKIHGYTLDVLGVLKYTFDSGFAMFAKAGAAYLNQDGKITAPFGNAYGSGDQFAPEAALGIGYVFTPKVELDLTASSVFVKQNSNNALATQAIMAGLVYNIG